MTVLRGRAADGILLAEALSGCARALSPMGTGAVLLYAADRCLLASVDRLGVVTDAKGARLDLAPFFEMRAFGPNAELRWLHDSQGQGRAVLLSEEEIGEYLSGDLPPLEAYDTISQTYLLWGKAAGATPGAGWSRLSEGRIGPLEVPLELPSGRRGQLCTLEYLDIVDDHGNVAVIEERLLRLAPEEEHG